MIRIRRDIHEHTGIVTYVEEVWGPLDEDLYENGIKFKGFRYVSSTGRIWRSLVGGWEKKAYDAGWAAPDNFEYVDTVPNCAIRTDNVNSYTLQREPDE